MLAYSVVISVRLEQFNEFNSTRNQKKNYIYIPLSVGVLLIFYDSYYILNDSLNRGEVIGIERLD